jgi:hypothetical protein
MGSSFTGYGGHGFWARAGILETWLAALADVGRPMPQAEPQSSRDRQLGRG